MISISPTSVQSFGFASRRLHRTPLRRLSDRCAALLRRSREHQSPSQLLRLSDHLLDDVGLSRAALEIQALQWPFRPKAPLRPD